MQSINVNAIIHLGSGERMPRTARIRRTTVQQQIVRDLIDRFPEAGAMTLAKRAYRENKECFASLDAARSAFRTQFGSMGKWHRNNRAPERYREPRKSGVGFEALPEGLTHFTNWEAYKMDGERKALVISDPHIPYHRRDVLLTALGHGKKHQCNTVILNGDIADFFAVSFWEKDPRKRRFAEELKTVANFLAQVRCEFPKATIVYKIGNHEERWERYMQVKAPELLDVEAFDIRELLSLNKLGIATVTDKRPIMLGKLNVIHGHEFKFGINNPVNPARGFFLRGKAHCLGGHFHQSSQHSEKNMEQLVVSTWSTGCLCDLHPDYAPLNQWNHGFAMVEVDRKGSFLVHNHKIINGEIY